MELTGRVIVGTGAARGIGRALAKRFASARPEAVIVADIDKSGAAKLAEEINGRSIHCDVSREADIEHLVNEVESIHGRIDVFCSNAGIAVGGGPEAKDDDWQRIWEVNVMAHVFVARHALPGMLARKEGYLIGTVSAAGLLNHFFAAPYGVTKAAALSLFEWLAIVHGDQGIRISCLCPQGVRTDMLEKERSQLGIDFLTAGAMEPETVADAGVKGIGEGKVLILPHPQGAEYFPRKTDDHDRRLRGVRPLRSHLLAPAR